MVRIQHLVLLLARLGLAVILIAHGWQKLVTDGVDQTATSFDQMGVPLPTVAAYFTMIVELFGGIALLIGLTVRLVGALVVIDMAGAFVLVHAPNGVFVDQGGFELVLAIGVGALLLIGFGGGAIGLDRLFRRTPVDADDEHAA